MLLLRSNLKFILFLFTFINQILLYTNMNILFYADVHIKDFSSFPPFNETDSNGLTKELNNTLQGFYFIRDYIDKNDINLVVNLGDTFNNVDTISTKSAYVAYQGLNAIKTSCESKEIDHLIIVGNHELLNEHKNIHNCSILNKYSDLVVDDYIEYTINDLKIALFPYTSNINKAREWIDRGQSSGLICTHQEFSGNKYESGMFTESKLSPKSKVQIVAGHIHLPQETEDVICCGSLIQNKFSQYSIFNNGLLTYDTDTKKFTRVFNNYSKHYVKIKEEDVPNIKNILNPLNSVVQVQVKDMDNKEHLTQYLKEYKHFIIKKYEHNQKTALENKVYSEFNFTDPKMLLNRYICDNNENAIDVFNEVFR